MITNYILKTFYKIYKFIDNNDNLFLQKLYKYSNILIGQQKINIITPVNIKIKYPNKPNSIN